MFGPHWKERYRFAGIQTRNVTCARWKDRGEVDSHLCDPSTEPSRTQSCNEEACPAEWFLGDWEKCSKPCGEGGTQARKVYCQQILSNARPSLVDDSICKEKFGYTPKNEQECNKDVVCPVWHVGPWKPVSLKSVLR